MTLAELQAVIWSQVRNLASPDPLTARTAMDAVLTAISAHVEWAAGPVVAARRGALQETL